MANIALPGMFYQQKPVSTIDIMADLVDEYHSYAYDILTPSLKYRIGLLADKIFSISHNIEDPNYLILFNIWLDLPIYNLSVYEIVYVENHRDSCKIYYEKKIVRID